MCFLAIAIAYSATTVFPADVCAIYREEEWSTMKRGEEKEEGREENGVGRNKKSVR
jgi:hypothetical protein